MIKIDKTWLLLAVILNWIINYNLSLSTTKYFQIKIHFHVQLKSYGNMDHGIWFHNYAVYGIINTFNFCIIIITNIKLKK